jgi:hypothetical protein
MAARKKTNISKQTITRNEYYRLVAEVRTLGAFIRELYLMMECHTHDGDGIMKQQEWDDAARKQLDEMFEKAVSEKYSQLLYAIEDISPSLAAELDDRVPGEIE